jgi:hypothetical protein
MRCPDGPRKLRGGGIDIKVVVAVGRWWMRGGRRRSERDRGAHQHVRRMMMSMRRMTLGVVSSN